LAAFGEALCIKRVDDRPFADAESGTAGSTRGAINAIMAAPWPLGVCDIRRRTLHQQVWQAIQDARP
jgi:hypothetical protein